MKPTRALAAVAIAVLVGGCGGDDNSTSAENPLSKTEFIKRAGEACERQRQDVLEKASAYSEEHKELPQSVLFARIFKAVFLPVVEAEVAAIRRLGAPAGDEARIEAILAAEQRGIQGLRRVKRADEYSEFTEQFTAADKILRNYGLVRCVK